MSRDMTDSEAISNLNHIYGIVSSDIQRSLDRAIKALEERQQNEWIKTSEKNPKRSGFYITTCEDICCRNIRVCGYDAVQKKWSRGGVVAWMPNPEPYED